MRNKWSVLVGCLIALTFSFAPIYLFTLGVFSKPMLAELGWTRTQMSAGFAVAQLAVAIFSTASGAILDRVGSRPVILFASLGLPLLLACFGGISSFPMYVALAFCMGAVGSASNPPSVLAILPKWFERNLGLSLSIASLGIGLGGVLMPMLARFAEGSFGWRGGFVALAVVVAIVGIVNALTLVRDRDVPGRRAASGDLAAPSPAVAISEQATFRDEDRASFFRVLRAWDYWLLVAAFTVIGAIYWGTTSQLGPILSDRGLGPAETASTLSVMGIVVILGRAAGGVLLDRMSAYLLGFIFFAAASLGCVLLTVSSLHGSPYIAAMLLGAALGGEGDVMAYVLNKRYGQRAYGKIFGLCFGVFNLGGLVGPLVLGAVYDRLHSYDTIGLIFGAAGLLAACVFFALGRTRQADHRAGPAAINVAPLR
ncbi:Nitrate/nitrite transporter NarK [Faunimonas pinastri]|uniref:Nitrate/nitrite transporter NarK n=1 Tax=Faunimonas pinastri TaxID=1855383 RepID=A0A1H9E3C1_9HYPH|nr:MFS transporter [Faunimonas pinastri]SEQ20147.1 Nitrate/nitrite transporter NarK [Faunimonas pinastri]